MTTKTTLEQNMRRIEGEIFALKITRPRVPAGPPISENVPVFEEIMRNVYSESMSADRTFYSSIEELTKTANSIPLGEETKDLVGQPSN
jgi:hypothetical protein